MVHVRESVDGRGSIGSGDREVLGGGGVVGSMGSIVGGIYDAYLVAKLEDVLGEV